MILSQALHHAEEPAAAIGSAHKILKPGGQILILDLLKHNFDKARELYGDRWLGFAESDLHRWLEDGGLQENRNQRRRARGTAAAFGGL